MDRIIAQDWIARARADLVNGITRWRIWWLLGLGDIRQRYARSRLGQFWITLSMAIFVGAIGTVYSVLFNQPIREFLPYIATNFVIWTFISGIIGDSATVFTQSEAFLKQEPLPKTIFIMRLLTRHTIFLAHNIIIIPFMFIFFGFIPTSAVLLVPFGVAMILITGFFAAMLLGILCTRFRDLPQIVQNLLQVAFFISPVMWPEAVVRARAPYIVDYNPFAALLKITAEPIRGIVPSFHTYMVVLCSTAVLAVLAITLFVRFRARIVYWL